MDGSTWWQITLGIISALIGSGGVLSWVRYRRSRGVPAHDTEAKLAVAPDAVPDWKTLAASYQQELAEARAEMLREMEERKRDILRELDRTNQKVARLERLREGDLQHIDNLEAHIWQRLPPPPPARPRTV